MKLVMLGNEAMMDEASKGMPGAPGIRAVEVDRGWGWLVDGFEVFKRAPGVWIAIVVILGVVMLATSFMPPLLGFLAANVLMPLFMGGLMLACRRQEQGETPEIADLFAGFKGHANQLALVGLLYTAGMVVLMLIVGGIGAVIGAGAMNIGTGAGMGLTVGGGTLLVMLVSVVLSVPLAMALWFAPALVVFQGMAPMAAMQHSFMGCLKNIVPFLVYGLLAFALSFVAAIPLMLGFLVVGPVLIVSVYAAYRDIYG